MPLVKGSLGQGCFLPRSCGPLSSSSSQNRPAVESGSKPPCGSQSLLFLNWAPRTLISGLFPHESGGVMVLTQAGPTLSLFPPSLRRGTKLIASPLFLLFSPFPPSLLSPSASFLLPLLPTTTSHPLCAVMLVLLLPHHSVLQTAYAISHHMTAMISLSSPPHSTYRPASPCAVLFLLLLLLCPLPLSSTLPPGHSVCSTCHQCRAAACPHRIVKDLLPLLHTRYPQPKHTKERTRVQATYSSP